MFSIPGKFIQKEPNSVWMVPIHLLDGLKQKVVRDSVQFPEEEICGLHVPSGGRAQDEGFVNIFTPMDVLLIESPEHIFPWAYITSSGVGEYEGVGELLGEMELVVVSELER